jgi:hypothetical protein
MSTDVSRRVRAKPPSDANSSDHAATYQQFNNHFIVRSLWYVFEHNTTPMIYRFRVRLATASTVQREGSEVVVDFGAYGRGRLADLAR